MSRGKDICTGLVILAFLTCAYHAGKNSVQPERGYLYCKDGEWNIGNIDIDMSNVSIPTGQYMINLEKEWCTNNGF
jgi:hypothetical protein